jgi:hypothetical protein
VGEVEDQTFVPVLQTQKGGKPRRAEDVVEEPLVGLGKQRKSASIQWGLHGALYSAPIQLLLGRYVRWYIPKHPLSYSDHSTPSAPHLASFGWQGETSACGVYDREQKDGLRVA